MPNLMLVNCPHCEADYKIERQQVLDALGRMHCGNCKADFEVELGAVVQPPELLTFPDFKPRQPIQQRALAGLAVFALLGVLIVQLLAWNWPAVSESRFAGPLASICKPLGCELHKGLKNNKLTITQLSAESPDGKTVVTALLSNNAITSMAWPDIQLIAMDGAGEAIGGLVVEPANYLTSEPGSAMPPRFSAKVKVSVKSVAQATAFRMLAVTGG